MRYFAGLDVSLEETAICVVDENGVIVKEVRATSEPEALIVALREVGLPLERVGLEACSLTAWLYEGLRQAGFSAICIETRQANAAMKAMPNKTDRNDARGIAQIPQAHSLFPDMTVRENVEMGAFTVLGGLHGRTIPNRDGMPSLEDIDGAIRPSVGAFPRSALLCLENSHNNCGGAVITGAQTRAAADLAHERGLKVHLDGARIFNAAAALGVDVKELTGPVDTVQFCFSKGLSAPVGLSSTGLPIGLQLHAPWGAEAALLDAAEHLETVTDRQHVDAVPPIGLEVTVR